MAFAAFEAFFAGWARRNGSVELARRRLAEESVKVVAESMAGDLGTAAARSAPTSSATMQILHNIWRGG